MQNKINGVEPFSAMQLFFFLRFLLTLLQRFSVLSRRWLRHSKSSLRQLVRYNEKEENEKMKSMTKMKKGLLRTALRISSFVCMCVFVCVCVQFFFKKTALKKLSSRKKISWLKWDSNPRPKTSALNWRLRPLGHPATCWLQMMTLDENTRIHRGKVVIIPHTWTWQTVTPNLSTSISQQNILKLQSNNEHYNNNEIFVFQVSPLRRVQT